MDKLAQEGMSTLDAALRERAPDVDPAAMERARARAERALFGSAEPARIHRYEIRERVGGGGMGVVYRAHDPELDREVALKVIHPRRRHDSLSSARMAKEAKALALLDHPNVVKVHDVLVHREQLVIVMELVTGETLAAWEERAPRTWREIVHVYAQAGDGLAAAHSLELVHRDFKPSNAVIGGDGRVRVLDFGLARSVESGEVSPREQQTADNHLTETGVMLGTLHYASPEQIEGRAISPASDQFSFCVALHRALEGVPPFDGDTAAMLVANIRSGKLRCSGRAIPLWLRKVIEQGLASQPTSRHRSMSALLAELRRPRGWRRWRTPILAGGAIASSVALTAFVGTRNPVDTCDGGRRQLADIWGPRQRDRVMESLASVDTPYARGVRPAVQATLDRYASAWSETHRQACRDHRGGVSSPLQLDRQMVCLAQRLGDLNASIDVLARTDRSSVGHVMDVAARMAPAEACMDPGEVEPPPHAFRGQVSAIRGEISRAEALARAGQIVEARAAIETATARAATAPYPPIEVEAALATGRIALFWGRDLQGAIAPLMHAKHLAFERGMYAAAVEASARLLYAEQMLNPGAERVEQAISDLVPLSAGLRGAPFAQPLLLNNIGAIYMALGDRRAAMQYFEQALAARGDGAALDLELTAIDRALAMATTDVQARDQLLANVWERLRGALGDDHPTALDVLFARAEFTLDPILAFERMSRVAESYAKHHPELHREVADSAMRRAVLAAELGDSRAEALYTTAIEASAAATDATVQQWHRLDRGELALLQRDAGRAVAELSAVRAARRTNERWWEREDGLRAEVGLGQAEALRGRDEDAIQYLDAAIRDYPQILAHSDLAYNRRFLARAQRELAAILRRTGRDPARASTLERAASEFYRLANPTAYARFLP